MLILALDTTTSGGSCALMRDNRIVREDASDSSRSHAARLPGELVSLLEREAVALAEIDGLAVGIGPGSFTGLRVGIATMQGLAVALNRPLFGVSALDALAHLAFGGSGTSAGPDPSGTAASVATWIDAWRGEVYAATYKDGREVEPATVARPAELLSRLLAEPTLFTGDGAAMYQD